MSQHNRIGNNEMKPDQQNNTDRKQLLNIGTWNVRTLAQSGKLENIKQEMTRTGLNILGISEMRWIGAGEMYSDNFRIIYSGGNNHTKGVGIILDAERAKMVKGFWTISERVMLLKLQGTPVDINIIQIYAPTTDSTEEELDDFYNQLQIAMKQCKAHEVTIVMGDFNAKVDSEKVDETTGGCGLGEKNDRGNTLIKWATINNMIIGTLGLNIIREDYGHGEVQITTHTIKLIIL